MHNTRYIYTFVFIMTAIVALALAMLFTFLKPIHDSNEATYNKKAILSAIDGKIDGDVKDLSDEEVQGIFDASIEQIVVDAKGNILDVATISANAEGATKAEEIDMAKQKKKAPEDRILPVYVYSGSSGEKTYILSVRGNGLWDEIWGNIALEEDLKTIAGVNFDHAQETPGLGAEIKDNAGWKKQFIGKSIYSADGEYTSIGVIKGGAKNDYNQVDGLTGATITADGVNDMLYSGLKLYEPYLNTLKRT